MNRMVSKNEARKVIRMRPNTEHFAYSDGRLCRYNCAGGFCSLGQPTAELDQPIEHHFDVMPAVYGAYLNTGEHWTEVFFATTKKTTLRSLFSTIHELQ